MKTPQHKAYLTYQDEVEETGTEAEIQKAEVEFQKRTAFIEEAGFDIDSLFDFFSQALHRVVAVRDEEITGVLKDFVKKFPHTELTYEIYEFLEKSLSHSEDKGESK